MAEHLKQEVLSTVIGACLLLLALCVFSAAIIMITEFSRKPTRRVSASLGQSLEKRPASRAEAPSAASYRPASESHTSWRRGHEVDPSAASSSGNISPPRSVTRALSACASGPALSPTATPNTRAAAAHPVAAANCAVRLGDKAPPTPASRPTHAPPAPAPPVPPPSAAPTSPFTHPLFPAPAPLRDPLQTLAQVHAQARTRARARAQASSQSLAVSPIRPRGPTRSQGASPAQSQGHGAAPAARAAPSGLATPPPAAAAAAPRGDAADPSVVSSGLGSGRRVASSGSFAVDDMLLSRLDVALASGAVRPEQAEELLKSWGCDLDDLMRDEFGTGRRRPPGVDSASAVALTTVVSASNSSSFIGMPRPCSNLSTGGRPVSGAHTVDDLLLSKIEMSLASGALRPEQAESILRSHGCDLEELLREEFGDTGVATL